MNQDLIKDKLELINSSFEYIDKIRNQQFKNRVKNIFNNAKYILENNQFLENDYGNSNIRYQDYYDESFHNNEIELLFTNDHQEEKDINSFMLYSFFRKFEDLLININEEEIDDLLPLLDIDNYYNDLEYLSGNLYKKVENKINENDNQMPFLNENNKYKIYFAGLAYKDIINLQKPIIKSLINKLYNPFSTNDIIPLSENVDHVNELYNFPLKRVQLADDYRIAYLREKNLTIILGVTLKTGKNIDYTRYDSVAKKKDELKDDINKYLFGKIDENSQHNETIKFLDEFYQKNIVSNHQL